MDKFDWRFKNYENIALKANLKICPFCGGEAHLSGRFPTGQYFIQCEECRASLWADREDKAIGLWNSRIKTDE